MTLLSEKAAKKTTRNTNKNASVKRIVNNSVAQATSTNSAPSEQVFEANNTTLKFALAGVTTLLLAGVALIVSANTHVPPTGSLLLDERLRAAAAASNSLTQNTEARHFIVRNPLVQETTNQAQQNLTTHSSQPLDYATYYRHLHGIARASIDAANNAAKKVTSQATAKLSSKSTESLRNINVNTFLLASRISNDSQLSQLQMQSIFADFNSSLFLTPDHSEANELDAHGAQNAFAGVGFPHIETNDRPNTSRYKPYRQLVSISGTQHGDIVPHIKCMGLSPERVAQRAERYNGKIIELALKHNVSASLVKAVVAKESCFNANARSHVGAIGLMQLMPETAKWLKVTQPTDVDQNLAAGVRYLAQLRKRFGSNELALAAYNAGPGNVERYNGIPPFAETQNYVKDVMHFYRGYVATTRFVNALNDYQ